MSQNIQLIGRIFLTFDIKTNTGLHIGGSDEGIGIGGVDKTVIRDTITNQPYIPGSSLRGKVRSLTEKYFNLEQNNKIGKIFIHTCGANARSEVEKQAASEKYQKCDVCQIYGVPGEMGFSTPTRLIVRDVKMGAESVTELQKLSTDLPFTESKTEVAIDRVTSAASPRQMERVPAGVTFGAAEMVYSLYDGAGCDSQTDLERFKTVITGLQLLEDDYLGGLGSRGSGKVELINIKVELKSAHDYDQRSMVGEYSSLQELVNNYDALKAKLAGAL